MPPNSGNEAVSQPESPYGVAVISPTAANYPYQFTPQQLMFLCERLLETATLPGNIAEFGCAHGYTTLFLNRFLDGMRYMPKKYYAIDTFRGFVPEDVAYEVDKRNKAGAMYTAFQDNSRETFDASMATASASRVISIEADVNEFDIKQLGELSFALVDVDLYRPIAKMLPEIYDLLTPGGIIVVDDCNPMNFYWDGAYEAYRGFVRTIGMPVNIVNQKLGLIRK